MKSFVIAIVMMLFAKTAVGQPQKLEEFFGGNIAYMFDLCEYINEFKLDQALNDNELGLLRKYIIRKNTYATNLYYTLAAQNMLDWDALDEMLFEVHEKLKKGIENGDFTLQDLVQMEDQCIERYLVRNFPLDVKIDGLNRMEFHTKLNQEFFEYFGLTSD